MSALDWYFLAAVALLLVGSALWTEMACPRRRRYRGRRRYYMEDEDDGER